MKSNRARGQAAQAARAEAENLPAQVGQLSEEVINLLEEHVQLVKAEVKQELSAYLRDGMILGLGGLVATIGFALVSARLPKGTGVLYMILGGATVLAMKNRLAQRKLIPQGIAEEIRQDQQWLRELT
jgi:hypothetical protein